MAQTGAKTLPFPVVRRSLSQPPAHTFFELDMVDSSKFAVEINFDPDCHSFNSEKRQQDSFVDVRV